MAAGIKRGKAVAYAKWCLQPDNPKAPHYVKLQAEQWLRIVNGQERDAKIDPAAYEKMCGLLRLMVHPDLGCSMYEGLEDYAWFLVTAIFCTKDRKGARYYETVLLEIARKNFKTFNAAVIFILLMLIEPKFSRFFSVAPDLKLSSELKLAIRKIIKSSPALADDAIFQVLRSEIRCKLTDSEYTPLAYSKDKMDGKQANAFLADEAGAMDSYPIEAMRSSQIVLRSKLGIIISTQYPNDDNAMIDEIDISKKTLDGLLDNRRRFSLLYEPDDALLLEERWISDDNVIYQSNPVTVKNEAVFQAVRDMRAMAVLYENKRENYLCKHNNIKYKGLGTEGYVEITRVRDYYTGKGGYAYIHRERGKFKSIHYADEAQISIQKNTDPIFKDFSIMVDGRSYRPYQFLKVLRNSRDGATGVPLTVESSKLIEVAYQTLCFEAYLVKKGGNKKGFLKSEKALTTEAMAALKEAYSNLYSNSSDNVVVLNRGIDFQESSATSVEMQLNENKVTNAEEFAKIFHISTATIGGQAADTDGLAKLAAIPLMVAIQCALNRDFLLEKEKGKLYWAFDTKELLKGDMKDRFEAYRTALEANFMQPDEVRFAEDMEPLGLNWIRLGLNDVLYDPKTKQIYTPNTNQTAIMGETMPEEEKAPESEEKGLPSGAKDDTMEAEKPEEARANPYHDPKNGRFTTGGGKAKKTKYAPSPQRNKVQIKLAPKRYARLCGTLGTLYPGLKKGEVRIIRDSKYQYTLEADGYGGFITKSVKKI